MSHNSTNMSLEDWTDDINARLDVIYNELCDFEQSVNAQMEPGDTEVKLMELLEAMNEIQRTARSIRPITNTLKDNEAQMREQMEMLEHTVELLHLENKTIAVDVKPAMQE